MKKRKCKNIFIFSDKRGEFGREAPHQTSAAEVRGNGHRGQAGQHHSRHDRGAVRSWTHPDTRSRREEPSAHHQRLVPIREYL